MAGVASTLGVATPTPNSFGSVVNNGQLVGVQTQSAYRPINWGGGVSAVPAASPLTIPPSVGYGFPSPASASSFGSAMASTPGLGGDTPNTTQRGSTSQGVVGGPGIWAFGLMAVGLLWLHFIHWRK